MLSTMLPPASSNIDVHAMMRGLVHELRNPLSAILTASSLLQSGEGIDEETVMLLDVVQKESRRMNRILTEFSSFVKPPATQPELFDVAKLLRDLTLDMQKEGTFGSQIEVRDELPTQITVFADPMQSYQAFQHLFTNAAQAMEQGGTLILHTQDVEAHAVIFLEDNGMGLSETALERAFQPFFSTKPAATGLGLAIAAGLLRASGGALYIENRHELNNSASKPLSGARVRVHLPRPGTMLS